MLNILIIKRTGCGHKDYSSLCNINSPLYEESELKWKLKKKIKKKIQFKSNGNFNMDFFTHKKRLIREVKELKSALYVSGCVTVCLSECMCKKEEDLNTFSIKIFHIYA